ncbi:MAG: Holliday junction resolvase RuvX [Bacillota bacterium]|nr:Holliday junction resolvase RuvX [Bacillota bacterium]
MRVFGLDVGSKTIGVAVSDELGWTAQGVTTLHWEESQLEEGLQKIKELLLQYQVDKIVLGLPKNMDGTEGERAQKVRNLGKALEKALEIPIVYWDERLSTVAAQKMLIAGDVSRKKRKKVIDKMAACMILQNYLDSKSNV